MYKAILGKFSKFLWYQNSIPNCTLSYSLYLFSIYSISDIPCVMVGYLFLSNNIIFEQIIIILLRITRRLVGQMSTPGALLSIIDRSNNDPIPPVF